MERCAAGDIMVTASLSWRRNLGPPRLSNIVSIAAGGAHNLALRADGTVVAWDYNNHGQTNVPPGLSNVVAIAAGGDHSLALKSDGRRSWLGQNSYGESTVPPGLGRVIAISAGFHDSMALVLPSSPTLQAQLAGGELVLSWPTNYPDFTLQCSPDLRTVDWTDCRSPPVVSGGQFWVTNPIPGSAEFFRLRGAVTTNNTRSTETHIRNRPRSSLSP